MEETPTLTTMTAKILRVCCCDLLVCDTCTCQEVLVHTPRACCFSVGGVCLHRVQRCHDHEHPPADHRHRHPPGLCVLLSCCRRGALPRLSYSKNGKGLRPFRFCTGRAALFHVI